MVPDTSVDFIHEGMCHSRLKGRPHVVTPLSAKPSRLETAYCFWQRPYIFFANVFKGPFE